MSKARRQLREIAHARAGDKDDTCNVAVFAYTADAYDFLLAHLTADVVRAHFAHRQVPTVKRYVMDHLRALNFVLDGALEGGVNSSLGLDGHGKALSYHLLALELELPADMEEGCRRARDVKWPTSL